MVYSEVTDLLIGDLETGASVNKDGFVNDAADEIDQNLGHRYKVPVVIGPDTPRLTSVTLKRISNYLASGRILMAAAQNDERLHGLGRYYVNEAKAALSAIATGQFILEGVETVGETAADTGPVLINEDDDSLVKTFYNIVGQDPLMFPYPAPGYYPQHIYGG